MRDRQIAIVERWAAGLGYETVWQIQARTGSVYLRLRHPITSRKVVVRFSDHAPRKAIKLSLHPNSRTSLDSVLYELVRKAGGKYYR